MTAVAAGLAARNGARRHVVDARRVDEDLGRRKSGVGRAFLARVIASVSRGHLVSGTG